MSELDQQLERMFAGMKAYVDSKDAALREEIGPYLGHFDARLVEAEQTIAGLVALQQVGGSDEYRRFVIEEAARMGVKPSEIMRARARAETRDEEGGATGDDGGAD